MNEGAINLVNHVLPEVPVRQFVLTMPFPLRFPLAFDGKLLGQVVRIFTDTVAGRCRCRWGDVIVAQQVPCAQTLLDVEICRMANAGAQAALRGYRLQALYTLFRLLEGEDGRIFQPEGREDLDILGPDGEALEFVQVKAHDGKLTLSLLEPSKPDSFFRRVLARTRVHPNARECVVSFGAFGHQMAAAWEHDGSERAETLRFLRQAGYTDLETKVILSRVQLEVADSTKIEEAVLEHLRNALSGVDPVAAFDLLHAWLFVSSEARQRLTRADLRERILAIGRFVSERAAHHDEWFRSVVPLSTKDIPANTTLRNEFYLGVSARYEHVAANVDVCRTIPLGAIEQAFSAERLVVIHGASGQGKSALAYRYLHDYVPEAWRFEVRLIEDRSHALKISQALLGHLSAIGAPAYVYVDVSPGEHAWIELVKALASYPLVRILVTIREEDWSRAVSPGSFLPFREIELRLDETEARDIYQRLVAGRPPAHLLSFEDAWSQFGGTGPLLEFAHFIVQNETLLARLSNQVRRLQDEVRIGKLQSNEVELLRRAAVVTAYGARLDLRRVSSGLSLRDPSRTLELFENEFLVRVDPKRLFIEGLHPIRSQMLASLLTDDAFHPWATAATSAFPAIADTDLEEFLLHAFTRHPDDTNTILGAIAVFTPKTWTAVGGILRSLLWLAVREYLRRNEPTVRETQSLFGSAWPFILTVDLGNVNAVAPGLVRPIFEDLVFIPEGRRRQFAELRARLSPGDVLGDAREWIRHLATPIDEPKDGTDWAAVAEIAFWISQFGFDATFVDRLPIRLLPRALENLDLNLAADLFYAFSFLSTVESKDMLTAVRPSLLTRFQQETATSAIEDDGLRIRAHFMLSSDSPSKLRAARSSSTQNNHVEAIRRIELLRRLVPERAEYGCQGYGHRLRSFPVEIDNTTKTGIPARQLPPPWPLRPNRTFMRLGEYMRRPSHWHDYARKVFATRVANVTALEALLQALERYFRKGRFDDSLSTRSAVDQWQAAIALVGEVVPFPKDAVDEWGQTSETAEGSTEQNDTSDDTERDNAKSKAIRPEIVPALQLHASYWKACREFFSPLLNFHQQAFEALPIIPLLGRLTTESGKIAFRALLANQGQPEDPGHLPTVNIFDVLKKLPRFQVEFRKRFAQYFSDNELGRLEQREEVTTRNMFSVWYQFSRSPERVVAKVVVDAERRMNLQLSQVKQQLRAELKKLTQSGIRVWIRRERVQWKGMPALWLTMDVPDPRVLWNAFSLVYQAVAASLPSEGPYELAHYSVLSAWENIHVIPFVGGRLLERASWRIAAQSVLGRGPHQQDVPWWQQMLQPLPGEIFEALKIPQQHWPSLDVVDHLSATATQLLFLVASHNDMARIPAATGAGTGVFEKAMALHLREVSELLIELPRAMSRVEGLVTADKTSAADEQDSAALLRDIAATLKEIRDFLLPTDGREETACMRSDQMDDWETRLHAVLPALANVRLSWLAYLLRKMACN